MRNGSSASTSARTSTGLPRLEHYRVSSDLLALLELPWLFWFGWRIMAGEGVSGVNLAYVLGNSSSMSPHGSLPHTGSPG